MFIHRHKVQFYETDLMGIVHHANYLRFFEESRVAWAHAKGMIDYQQPSSAAHFAVLETQVRHLLPSFFGDELEVETQAKMIGVRITFEYKIYCRARSPLPIAQGRSAHAPLDENLKPIKPPAHIRQAFKGGTMDRNLALEFVRITEAAALACARYMGRGDEKAADKAAVDAMSKAFDTVRIDGTVVIGEGERDEAPMLYIGEKVGRKTEDAPGIDIALDPLEGTTICAVGGVGATSVIAVAEKGNFLHVPDTYMDKIACGPAAKGVIDIDLSATENVIRVAKALDKPIEDLTVVILDRPRHKDLIAEVRRLGARIHLIGDGDVSAAIASAWPDSGIDMLMGTGGAPEGVISAAALRCLGGDFQGRLNFRNDHERERAKKMGITDLKRKYKIDELAKGSVMFCATGVTDGPLLKGVKTLPGRMSKTHSIVMRSKSGTIRTIEALHNLNTKPGVNPEVS